LSGATALAGPPLLHQLSHLLCGRELAVGDVGLGLAQACHRLRVTEKFQSCLKDSRSSTDIRTT